MTHLQMLRMKSAGESDVEQITHATASMDLDPQYYLKQTPTGEPKPLLITGYMSVTVQDTGEEIQLGQGVTLKLAGTAKPKLSSVSPALWISANTRMMAELVDRETWTSAASRTTWPTQKKWGELASRYTWASLLLYDEEYRCPQAVAQCQWGADS